MIENLNIQGLKSIENINDVCSNFNILLGTNSAGKSTVLQSLLLLSQNIVEKHGINGPMVSLGEFREIKNFNVSSDSITIEVKNEQENISICLQEDELIPTDSERTIGPLANSIDYQNNKVHYLSCNRIGSMDIYQKNLQQNDNIGINGEYAVDYLRKHGSYPIRENMCISKESFTLNTQVNYWLRYIVGANIKVENIIGTDVVKAEYSMVDGKYSRPKNVGSGISYLISIIVMCLGSYEEDIIIIENPEIHLHPLAQSKLCEFLYFIASQKRQLFVETHSDHIFNGVRVGIATQKMDYKQISVSFFELNEKNCTVCHNVVFGKHGKIINQIKNLFDQFEIDLDRMIGLE